MATDPIKEEIDDSRVISAKSLLKLAADAMECGAFRYAEAFELVANRLLHTEWGNGVADGPPDSRRL